MNIKTFDDDAFAVDAESFFHLWCCDCSLRHLVTIEAIGKGSDIFKSEGGKIAIGFTRDEESTRMARKEQKIVVYTRKK